MALRMSNLVSTALFIFIFTLFTRSCYTSFTQNYYGLHDIDEEDIPEGASTLAFVFDITGSMYDDLVQVIEGAARIFSTILARREKSIYNYVLVPFHDPDIGPVTVTTDPDLYQRQLKDLYVQGGGDCPEMSIGAIKLALEVSLPNSHIYVFTDARSKDYYLLDDVLKLIQRKQSQVVFVMTGDCGNHSHPGYQAYEHIASTSSGQVFHLRKSDVDEVLNFVRVSLQARKVNLFAVNRHATDLREYAFDIDGSLKEFTISVSGENPIITLINSRGEIVDERKGLNDLLSHKNISIVNIKDPPPGKWKLKVNSEGSHTIRATGLSKIDFVHGFSRQPTGNLKETYHRPLKGAPTYLLVNATDLPAPASFQSVKIVDLEGKNLQKIPLYRFPGSNLFNASTFYPPDDYFYLKIAGTDEYGYPIERVTSTAISAQLPDAPEVSTRSRMSGYYEEDTDLRCYVQSLVPFSVTWYKEGVQISQEQQFPQTTENILTVPEVTMLSEGYYSCNASNIAGSSASVIFLDVKPPPPIITHYGNVSGSVGNFIVLPCDVESVVDHNLTWNRIVADKRDSSSIKVVPIPDLAKIIIHSNGSLIIKKIAKGDEGWYRCTAANEGGVVQEHIYLHSYDPPIVFVMPQVKKFATGDAINISCIAHGYPEPSVRWVWSPVHNQNIYSGHTKIVGKNLIINSANPEDEGRYDCIATNVAGSEITSAFLHYIEPPVISLPDRELLVKNGDQATLRCIAEGIPDVKVTWYKGNFEIHLLSFIHLTEDGSLIINDVQDTDAANYTCVATNEAGVSNETMSLMVGSKPSLIKLPMVVSVDVLQNVSIPCVATGIPSPQIMWHLNNRTSHLTNNKITLTSSGILLIREADPSVASTYVCQAENRFGIDQQEVELRITGIKKPVLAPLPESLDVNKGESRIIPCVILEGNPKPEISWLRNNNHIIPGYNIEIDEDTKLIISNADQFHEANFTCFASNIGGNTSETISINIMFQPEIFDSAQEFTVVLDSAISLPCNVVGDPKPTIQWHKDGAVLKSHKNLILKSDGSLKIKVAAEVDGGQYACVATNIVGMTKKHLKLVVQVPPRIIQDYIVYNTTEGDIVTLNCKTYAKPAAFIEWKKNNNLKYNFEKYILHNGSLQFTAKLSDSGYYTCTASNDAGQAKQEVMLNVFVSPQANIKVDAITLIKGDTLTIVCETSGIPFPSVHWSKDNSTIYTSHMESQNIYVLIIDNIDSVQEGEYWCIAENLVGSASAKIDVTVHELPKIYFNNTEISAVVGDKVNLECHASGYPKPIITWKTPTENSLALDSKNGVLHIPFVQKTDSGIYKCTAENAAGYDTGMLNFSAFTVPIFEKKLPDNNDVIEGNALILDCSVSSFPPPVIKWQKRGTSLYLENSTNLNILEDGTKLVIPNANITDSGEYICVASNVAGETSNEFSVNVLMPPKFESPLATSVQVLKGEEILLDCFAVGHPEPIFIWKKNHQIISSTSTLGLQFGLHGRHLKVKHSRETDSGIYTCMGMNKVGSISQDFEVSVLVPPHIQGNYYSEEDANLHQITHLQCIVSGAPFPLITWYKNGKELALQNTEIYYEDNKQKLMFLKPEEGDSGTYTCEAMNTVGKAKKDVRLNVLVPPYIENQSVTETSQIKEGKDLILKCITSGNPQPRVSWLKNNTLLTLQNSSYYIFSQNNNIWEIINVSIHDAGRYTCIASNKAGSIEKDFSVTVLSPPKLESLPKYSSKSTSESDKKQVLENRPLVLFCRFSGNPQPQIIWMKDGLILNPSSNVATFNQGQQLHIKYAKAEHAGKYICVAKNEAGESQRQFDVHVLVPPSIENSEILSVLQVKEGESLALHCNAIGDPLPSMIWIKDGIELSNVPGYKFSGGNSKLEKKNIDSFDSGKYACIASNVAGTSEKEFAVDVLVPPHLNNEFSEAKGRQTVQIYKPVTLACPIVGNPPPEIHWLKDGDFIDFSYSQNLHTYGDGDQISISRTKADDTGLYTCIADNGVGNNSYDFELEILVPPSINRRNLKTTHYVRENEPITIKCPVTGYPLPVITWLKDEELLQSSSLSLITFSEHFQHLHLKFASLKNAGKYTCIARNEIGTDEQEFKLDVQVPPKIENSEDAIRNLTSVINKPITISCPVFGNPRPVLTWLKNGKIMNRHTNSNIMFSPDFKHLKIFHTKLSDAATYTCKAANDVGTIEKEFILSVHFPPKILETTTNNVNDDTDDYFSEDVKDSRNSLKAAENETTQFECYVDGNPKPIVLWLKDGHVLDFLDGKYVELLDGQMLKIVDIKVTDSGVYTCVVSNIVGTNEKIFMLDVLVPPKIKKPVSSQVLSSHPATIECLAESNPPAVISWLKHGLPFDFSQNRLITTGEAGRKLQFLKTSPVDNGYYTCVAENGVGKTEAVYHLDVHVAPTIKDSFIQPEVTENEKVIIMCNYSGNPEPSVLWLKNGDFLSETALKDMKIKKLNKFTLELQEAKSHHSGQYKCIVSNNVAVAEKSFDLYVRVPPQIVNTSEPNKTIFIQQPVYMYCLVEAKPQAIITWFKEENILNPSIDPYIHILEDGQKLQILRTREMDNGQYSCEAVNSVGNDSRSFMLNILIPPRVKNIVQEDSRPQIAKAIKGDSAELQCYVYGNPQPIVSWLKDGKVLHSDNAKKVQILENDQLLRIANVEIEDGGQYTCIASSPLGSEERHFDIFVQVPPKISNDLKTEYVAQLNKAVILHCEADGNPKPLITWLKNGLLIDEYLDPNLQLLKQESAILIRFARIEDSGKYTCVASSSAGQDEKHFNIQIHSPAFIIHSDLENSVFTLHNQAASLHCPASGIPAPTISWLKENEPIASKSFGNKFQVLEDGKTLRINSAKEADIGNFTCVVFNDAGSDEANFFLDILFPPKINQTQKETKFKVHEGESIDLHCPLQDSKHMVTIAWTKNDKYLTQSYKPPHFEFSSDSKQLKIMRAQSEDTGIYKCIASNAAGDLLHEMNLLVLAPAKIIYPTEAITATYVKEHHSTVLECVILGHPEPNLQWKKDSLLYTQFPNLVLLTHGKLKIVNATLNEAGIYTCHASNEGGADEKSYNLTVYVPPSINVSSHGIHKVALLNEEIYFSCPTEGNPLPKVMWYKDSQILMQGQRVSFSEDGMSVRISHATARDSGKYTCMAVNEAGNSEAEQFLKIYIPPHIDNINIQGLPVVNQSVRIHCETQGFPSPIIAWYKDNELLNLDTKKYGFFGDGRFLDVLDAQVSDSGMYTCQAKNTAGQAEKAVSLSVYAPPNLESGLQRDYHVISGKPLRIDCDVSGIPPPIIVWLKNNMPLTSKDHINFLNNDYTILFSYTLESDAAIYSCIATNSVGSVEQKFNLTVLVPPFFNYQNTENISAALGSSIKMNCYSSGYPEPDIIWSYNNSLLTIDSSISIANEVLTIKNVDLIHSGIYSCEASNVAGKVSKTFNLNVNIPPVIKDGNDTVFISIVKNDPVTMECPASGIPQPNIVWFRKNILLLPEHISDIYSNFQGAKLSIQHSKPSDTGTYMCLATNSAGNTTKKFVLNVLEQPAIRSIYNIMKPLLGTEATLDCIAEGIPIPEIYWLKDGIPVSSLLKRINILGKSSLVLNNMQFQDTGNYTCVASNEAGSASADVIVDVISPPTIKAKENNQKVLSGESTSLFCEVHGYPVPVIMWHKDASIMQTNDKYTVLPDGTLLVKNTTEADSGTYKCFAENEAGTLEVTRKLDVLVPPKIVIDFVTEYNVAQTNSVVLQCSARGSPPPLMAWEKNGVSIDLDNPRYKVFGSGDFHISLIQSSDMGIYSCIAKNEAGSDKKDISLIVSVPPTVSIDKPKNIIVIKGATVKASCSAKGFPPPQISWHKTGNFASETYMDEKLIIENIQPNNGGSYVCVAVNKAGKDHQSISIQVHTPPVFKILPKSQDVSVGATVSLTCEADGYPIPTITWLINNTQLNDHSYSTLGYSILNLENVGKEDQGTYICLSQNAAGERKAAATVYVRTPPEIVFSSDIKRIQLKEAVMLDCAVRGDPAPNIIWIKNGLRLEVNQRIQQIENGSLVIYNSSNEDSGQYKCVASNNFGSAEKMAELIIRSKPEFIIRPYNSKADLGDNIYLHCKVTGEPKPKIVWKRNQTLIESGKHALIFSNNTLKILAAQVSDEGTYSCIANNSLGSVIAESSLIIQVHGKWSQWYDWSHCTASCGEGYQQRERFCNNPSPKNGGKYCIGVSTETRQCSEIFCPVNGDWGNWMEWGNCSKNCGIGLKVRHRKCDNPTPSNGGLNCTGNGTEFESCEIRKCPVDGNWSSWSTWEPCNVSCGKGIQTRIRNCNNPEPSHGGSYCFGDMKEIKTCTMLNCEVHGEWGGWTEWSLCSSSCGGGTRERIRKCDSPEPLHGGKFCSGPNIQMDYCNNHQCPVNGDWSHWSPWGECSASCNKGQRKRFRSCNSPAPNSGGRDCFGPSEEIEICNTHLCPIDGKWSSWSEWSICSVTCGVGFHSRIRACENPLNGGRECFGDNQELEECGDEACDAAPVQAVGYVIGIINGVDIGLSRMRANVSLFGMEQTVMAVIENITEDTADWMKIITPLLAPIYWTTAYEIGDAVNGYTLTKGFFRRETQVNFVNGETLHMTHVARGLDKRGNILLDIVISGDVPDPHVKSDITVFPFTEDYIQTGAGLLYALSTHSYKIGNHLLPYSWNHSIFYDEAERKMPYLVERLYAKGISSYYDQAKQEMNYVISAAISKGLPNNECLDGFILNPEGFYCIDFDECELNNPCSHACSNFPGGFSCHCHSGFTLDNDGRTCNDTDECELGIDSCSSSQECVNVNGSYKCLVICRTGYKRSEDEMYCQDIDECLDDTHVCSQLCLNTIGSYDCTCNKGYYLIGHSECIDVDECNQVNPPCSHTCTNILGAFLCLCPTGYELQNDTICQDVNECELDINICLENQVCRNVQGSYECHDVCLPGFSRADNGLCTDVDECHVQGSECHLSQTCINTHGSYDCSCVLGYYSDGPGKPCQDIDECETQGTCQHICENILGSYRCICPTGYRLNSAGKTCQDIDECTELQISCGKNRMCFNTRGSFDCIETPCPEKYDRDPLTGYCKLDCGKAENVCPPNIKYAEILAFKTVALTSGIQAYQDVVRLVAYDQDGNQLPNTAFSIIENETGVPFRIRLESGKGLLYAQKSMNSNQDYQIKVQAISYDTNSHVIQYMTKFLVFISVSKYPY